MGSTHTKPCPMFHERFAFCAHLYELTYLRNISIFSIFFVIGNSACTIYYYWTHWDLRLFIKNAFMLIIVCFDSQMIFEALLSANLHFEGEKIKEKMWTVREAGPEVHQQIEKDINILKHMRIFISFLLLITALNCLPISGDIREFFCILNLVEDLEKQFWYPFLKYGFVLVKFFFGLTFSNPLYMILCVIGDCSYGLMILRQKIRSIEDIFGSREIWYYDRVYQKYVEMTLVRCIKEHQTILQYHKLAASIMKRNFFVAYLVTVTLLTSFYFNVKMNFNEKVMMKTIFIVIVCVLFLFLFTRIGEVVKNQCEGLYRDLCGCPWFLWNKSNKSLYLMFLIHAREPMAVRSLSLDLGYPVLVKLGKTAMSLLTAIEKLIT